MRIGDTLIGCFVAMKLANIDLSDTQRDANTPCDYDETAPEPNSQTASPCLRDKESGLA